MRIVIAAIAIGSLAVASPAAAKKSEPFSAEDGRPVGRGSVLNGPNGVNVGPDGNVYVASGIGNEITVHDPRTGAILDRIGPERGVHGPDDLVVAPDGHPLRDVHERHVRRAPYHAGRRDTARARNHNHIIYNDVRVPLDHL